MVDVTGPDYAYITDAFGTINSNAKGIMHVVRVKVVWNESCLVNNKESPTISQA